MYNEHSLPDFTAVFFLMNITGWTYSAYVWNSKRRLRKNNYQYRPYSNYIFSHTSYNFWIDIQIICTIHRRDRHQKLYLINVSKIDEHFIGYQMGCCVTMLLAVRRHSSQNGLKIQAIIISLCMKSEVELVQVNPS